MPSIIEGKIADGAKGEKMKWNKFTIETTTQAEDFVSAMLNDLGIEGIEIEDNKIKNVTFTEKKPVRLKVTIAYHDYCSMEVKAYGHKI